MFRPVIVPLASLALTIGSLTGASAVPVFSVSYGYNTTISPFDFIDTGPAPVSGTMGTVNTNNIYGAPAKSVTVDVSAERGRLRVTNTVQIFDQYSYNRSEGTASFSGEILFCQGGSLAPTGGCLPPTQPVPQPFVVRLPSLQASGSINATNGNVVGTASGVVRTNIYTNGSLVASKTVQAKTSSSSAVYKSINQPGGLIFPLDAVTVCDATGCRLQFRVDVETTVGCNSGPGCQASVLMGNSLNFFEGQDLFENLPAGISVWSPDLNIFDNRWYSPETLAANNVPAPASTPLFLVGLALLYTLTLKPSWWRRGYRAPTSAPGH